MHDNGRYSQYRDRHPESDTQVARLAASLLINNRCKEGADYGKQFRWLVSQATKEGVLNASEHTIYHRSLLPARYQQSMLRVRRWLQTIGLLQTQYQEREYRCFFTTAGWEASKLEQEKLKLLLQETFAQWRTGCLTDENVNAQLCCIFDHKTAAEMLSKLIEIASTCPWDIKATSVRQLTEEKELNTVLTMAKVLVDMNLGSFAYRMKESKEFV